MPNDRGRQAEEIEGRVLLRLFSGRNSATVREMKAAIGRLK